MARSRTDDLPDLSALLIPRNALMTAVEMVVLRHRTSAQVAASLPEQIAARLAGIITLDLVHSGQRFLEQDISDALDVSRAPVREALRILERDRLVEFQPRRGAAVTHPTEKGLQDLFRTRSALYGLVLRDEMTEQPEELLALFDRHMPEVIRAGGESVEAYAVATFLLNADVADLANNKVLGDLLQSLSLQTLRYVRLGLAADPDAIQRFQKSWESLHEAIRERDVERVVELAHGRIDAIRDLATTVLTSEASGVRAASRAAVKRAATGSPAAGSPATDSAPDRPLAI